MMEEEVKGIVEEWVAQLRSDKLVHGMLELALGERERTDVELSVTLRTSGEKVVMQPRIVVRR